MFLFIIGGKKVKQHSPATAAAIKKKVKETFGEDTDEEPEDQASQDKDAPADAPGGGEENPAVYDIESVSDIGMSS